MVSTVATLTLLMAVSSREEITKIARDKLGGLFKKKLYHMLYVNAFKATDCDKCNDFF